MKTTKTFLIALLAIASLDFTVGTRSHADPAELIGTWEFTKLLDEHGKHIDTLHDNDGIIIVNGPKLIFKEDGTYSSQYPNSSIDNGTWAYIKKSHEVVLKLYWKKPYDEIANYIMTLGYSKKDDHGDYYDLIPYEIVELTNDKLVLREKENRQRVFKKAK